MTKQQEKLLVEKVIRPMVKKALREDIKNLRSHDLWTKLVEIIEKNNNRPSYLSQKYNGQEIFDALNNLLELIDNRWKK